MAKKSFKQIQKEMEELRKELKQTQNKKENSRFFPPSFSDNTKDINNRTNLEQTIKQQDSNKRKT